MLAERDLGRNIRSSRQTVGQYLDHWLDICARPRLRAKSFRDYSSLLSRYVRPYLGSRSFGGAFVSGNSDALQRVAEPKALGPHDLLYACGSLLGIETGGPLETPPNEPGRGCLSAATTTAAFTVFDVGQAKQFIAAISGHEYEAIFALALTTGMRPSEYLALTWTDLNLEFGT